MQASRASELRLKAELNAEKVAHNEATSAMLDARADRANCQKQLEEAEAACKKLRKESRQLQRNQTQRAELKLQLEQSQVAHKVAFSSDLTGPFAWQPSLQSLLSQQIPDCCS